MKIENIENKINKRLKVLRFTQFVTITEGNQSIVVTVLDSDGETFDRFAVFPEKLS